jgi:undecaprenyl pyrophosphate phosphatase UppP
MSWRARASRASKTFRLTPAQRSGWRWVCLGCIVLALLILIAGVLLLPTTSAVLIIGGPIAGALVVFGLVMLLAIWRYGNAG